MTFDELVARIEQMKLHKNRGDREVRILVCEPAMGPRPTVGVKDIHFGGDWNGNHVLITAAEPLRRQEE